MAEERINAEQVKHVAELAKLEFTTEQLTMFTGQLEKIIGMFEDLSKVDTTDVPVTSRVSDRQNALRDDVAVKSNDREALLANAPQAANGLIKVPAIIDESGDGE
ncbi:Asp-tRNA(Asn)/Glu-tRNA(Gln) amidotransferase subunit GatC [Lactiplantibacillus mudanjiangensis]|uniref:Aspartyl/glutamyl-tRNA(Asn/Gln) amidotransferase subunit C n=1 Tax=Lactiplantibacillus mudanjiangensis TaxID=1296538 RepID=A0A660E2B1_9LACO|nr:Asp-tRNA(Asn)/Glu-tRNA(Gln) amidotransferase subunit GatC [Lactiplantibacillus mudanjiangensis]VDG17625.1 Asp-tRNA(Asn)/Glu-tRNA(Gln) amidotransferase GatCAB subunit C [Lactobacillus sp.] [Lactiplantibacillus mudanjiangensis]VDG23102.1 Asp-tRNA(Asn)/Glu-tRNA(Gln) amidotransferase GatCAB subunit C [Lactobacillus sp.] [Lactiplantibacillus mudanjiangensis]VDG29572.1 Asp-tRNA(Asn)/Glu-tRNA(Gln) amidotransferase GatCAB subunit C [Lactobacillus sp.] [Lactiplantibacillus mudanjiangensis]VDG32685.1 